jgi:hypothetical protein
MTPPINTGRAVNDLSPGPGTGLPVDVYHPAVTAIAASSPHISEAAGDVTGDR